MNKKPFERYAQIKNQIKDLTLEAKNLEIAVTEEMEDFDTIETNDGTFYFTARKRWSYSPAVTTLEKELKSKKREEEVAGKITYSETRSLSFRAVQAE